MPVSYDEDISREPEGETTEFPVCTQHPLTYWSSCPDCRAQVAAEQAEQDAGNATEIVQHNREFDEALRMASGALNHTIAELGHLMSDSVHDIELTESTLGDDAKAELETAARAVRNVQRIATLRLKMMEG
jgi:hypothetical protein